ncbi:tyrosine-protein phosphatase non-receptor type substrate 1-like isoform X1 [Hemitrygon akajei]|uniref:tyrosine-protein phosphatase non-receptor type substrate 1-like isoform X1 n=2 Tax=Hemitrygon akajei TaxID=2704970 RepID=UPI003BF9C3D8
MTAMFLLLFLSLSRITCSDAEEASITVTQMPERQIIWMGRSIIFHCIIPLTYDQSRIEVRWRKQGENEYLQNEVTGRKRLVSKNKGGGYFELLNATIQDSGIYQCVVMRDGKTIGEGDGSDLKVCAAPTPLKFSSRALRNSSATLVLVCETAEFYPRELNITWYKNGAPATTDISTFKQENTEGLFKVSSFFQFPVSTSEVNGTVCICLVQHISLRTPAIAIYTVPNSYRELDGKFKLIWASGCAIGGMAILILLIIAGKKCIFMNKSKHGDTDTADHEDLVEENKILTYAAVDTRNSNQKWRQKGEDEASYAQVKQESVREGLTYATVKLSGSAKTEKLKTKSKDTEYAKLQSAKP